MMYVLPGLSFHEYIEFVTGNSFPVFSLEEILKEHERIALEITQKIRPYAFFKNYLLQGYYPFFVEAPNTFSFRLEAAINPPKPNSFYPPFPKLYSANNT